ncbi:NUDIX domain-containing protein [Streptomyces sp. t39]|uniref:NUDIX domain-containing protein n=1 Tax=Streptomyces sp. t39 TaxID=1828156 RepID=UPI0011CDD177|nr:NUDIX domain-containing protein [Streptomyces sp. t39]TXS57621.1 NUDIX hydrolase [Streptomyces sp. t39]
MGVHRHLERHGRVPLGPRHPDVACPGGVRHALAGHCEDEPARACPVREAYEEAGPVIDADDLGLVHTVHAADRPGGQPRIPLFFRPRRRTGGAEVREPVTCVGWRWRSAAEPPRRIVPCTRAATDGIGAGRPCTASGWQGRPAARPAGRPR